MMDLLQLWKLGLIVLAQVAGGSGQISCTFDDLTYCSFASVPTLFLPTRNPWGLSKTTVPTPNTGPFSDQSNNGNSYYAFFESTDCLNSRPAFTGASLVSPDLTEIQGTTVSITFYIFLRGTGIGLFELVRDDNSASFNDWRAGSWRQTISLGADPIPQWRQVQFEIPVSSPNAFKIKFAASCNGTSVLGDIAIDNIQTGVWSAFNCPATCSSLVTGTRTCTKGTCVGPATQCCPCFPGCSGPFTPPTFFLRPADITVNQGQRATFTCEANGTPPVTGISWLKGTTAIVQGGNYEIVGTVDRSSLSIVAAAIGDASQYTCRAVNAAGVSVSTATLSVTVPLSITVGPVSTRATFGTDATLTCEGTGNSVTVTWSKAGAGTLSNGLQYRIVTNSAAGTWNSALTVLSVDRTSGGFYTCAAVRGANSAERSADLAVFSVTVISVPPSPVSALPGADALFTCSAVEPPVAITWLFNGLSLTDGSKYRIAVTTTSLAVRSDLTVRAVTATDGGTYTCRATNGLTTDEDPAALSVISNAPTQVEAMVDSVQLPGSNVNFVCHVRGIPTPDILWLRNDQPLNIASDRRLSVSTTNPGTNIVRSVLSITGITAQDKATYSCVATNGGGSLKINATLTVAVFGGWGPWTPAQCQVTCGQDAVFPVQSRACDQPNPEPATGQYLCLTTSGTRGSAETRFNQPCGLAPCPAVPSLLGTMANQQVYEGRSAMFVCNVTGVPTPSIVWSKGGVSVVAGDRFSVTETRAPPTVSSVLLVNPVKTDDEGTYTCTATNNVGSTFASATLLVDVDGGWTDFVYDSCSVTCGMGVRQGSRTCTKPPPRNNGLPCVGAVNAVQSCNLDPCAVPPTQAGPMVDLVQPAGSNVEFVCHVHGFPSPDILWLRNSLPLNIGSDVRLSVSRTTPGPNLVRSVLSITGIIAQDKGTYSCNATNSGGSLTISALLTVAVFGGWGPWKPAQCQVTCGQDAVIPVQSRNCDQPPPEPATSQYLCLTTSGTRGSAETRFNQSCGLAPCPVPPRVLSSMGNQNVNANQSAMFVCNVTGVPTPSIVWSRNGVAVVVGGRYVVTESREPPSVYSVLLVNPVRTEDAGTFTCTATNSISSVSSSATLRVTENAVDGGWTGWSDTSECSKTCGVGEKWRHRHCTSPAPQNDGLQCLLVNGVDRGADEYQLVPCSIRPCGGIWQPWGEWSGCSVTCGKGVAHRHRACLPNTGVCEGNATEYQECDTGVVCPQPGGWGSWSSPPCPVTCGNGSVIRHRHCIGPNPCVGPSEEQVVCTSAVICPVLPGWSDWTPYTDCTRTCGGGQSVRARYCNNPSPSGPGAAMCKDSTGGLAMTETQTLSCNSMCCPVDGYWEEWGPYLECSKSCGNGSQLRYRKCRDPICGGKPCSGDSVEVTPCNQVPCPVNGGWGNWTDWSPCSATCGPQMTRERTRVCDNPPPQYGGAICSGSNRETQLCPVNEIPACPVLRVGDCNFETAVVACGYSTTHDENKAPHWLVNQGPTPTELTGPDGDATFPVTGSGHYIYFEASGINPGTTADLESPPINALGPLYCLTFSYHMYDSSTGFMGKLEVYVKKNGGLSKVYEKSGNQGANWLRAAVDLVVDANMDFEIVFRATRGSEYLSDIGLDDIKVILGKCNLPVDGKWSDWSDWTSCDGECDHVKYQTRERHCEGPFNMGKPCVGNSTETRLCPPKPCPIDGGWGPYTLWTPCPTDTCGVRSVQQRLRECNNPAPKYGGKVCDGAPSELRLCPFTPCPVAGTWAPWEPWTACTRPCGGGHAHRYRTCRTIAPSQGGQDCIGEAEQSMACNTNPCDVCPAGQTPVTCTVDPCLTSTCVGYPTATCVVNFCGTCHSDYYVNGLLVDCQPGVWGSWSDWSGCDKTCGGGHQHRNRRCLSGSCQGPADETSSCNAQACPIGGCPPDKALVVCTADPCLTATCPSFPTAVCTANYCGGCNTEWRVQGHLVNCGGPPGWSNWSSYSTCSVSCGTGVNTRTRRCDSPPPRVGEACLGPDRETAACSMPTC